MTRASRPPWGWVVPSTAGRSSFAGVDVEQAERAVWRRTRAAGWVAAAAGGLVAVVETIDAADTLSTRAADAYLLSTPSGAAPRRCWATMVALTVLRRRWRVAAVAAAAALLAVAVGGHAGSASPRLLAIGADWLHLAGGAVWAGGIAHIVAAWAPSLRRMSALDRQSVIREVLGGFGRIAMPAFGVVVLAGLATAVLQLGQVQALWQTSYGVALAVKIALVGVIGALSYVHAVRLRPRLLAGVEASPRRERRHWRLLRSEPVVAGAAVAVAALLAVFPCRRDSSSRRRRPAATEASRRAQCLLRRPASCRSPSRPGRGSRRSGSGETGNACAAPSACSTSTPSRSALVFV